MNPVTLFIMIVTQLKDGNRFVKEKEFDRKPRKHKTNRSSSRHLHI